MSANQPLEFCREWADGDNDPARDANFTRCEEPAMVIIWGKHFRPEALGPKCQFHAAIHLPDLSRRTLSQYAVFDLRGLVRQ